jgi:site-specific DNA recombinase
LLKIERTIKSIITAIEDGMYQPSMKARMEGVNPNIAEIYWSKVHHLSLALADPITAQESTTAIRSLIEEIVLMPGDRHGEVQATLRGELMSILDFADGRNEKRTNVPQVIAAMASSPRNHS